MTERQQEKAFQTFIGRRKTDSPPVIFPPQPRRLFERWPVIVGVATIIGLLVAAHFLSGCKLIERNMKYGHLVGGAK